MSTKKRRKIDIVGSPPPRIQTCSLAISETPHRSSDVVNTSSPEGAAIDWTLCCLCQKDDAEEKLQRSKDATRSDRDPEVAYKNLADRKKAFEAIGMLPIPFDVRLLECNMDLSESLYRNSAKFHQSCKLKFAQIKLDRAIKTHGKHKTISTTPVDCKRETRSQSSNSTPTPAETCFLCDMPSNSDNSLHFVQSFRLDQRFRRCANILKDSSLYAKLQTGDLIAQDAMYHRLCLAKLYKNASKLQLEGHYTDNERKLHGIAFGEVVSFIEEVAMSDTDKIPVCRLSDLIRLYEGHLQDLGIKLETRIHSTRFKNRLLSQFEDLSAYNEGKEVMLAFDHNIGEVITSAAGINYDDDGYILAKAASILRRYSFLL